MVAVSSNCSFVIAGDFSVSLSDEGKPDTVTLGELDEGLLALTNGETVGLTSGEGLAIDVLDVDDLVGTGVVFNVHGGADATDTVAAGDEHSGAVLEFNNAVDLAALQVKLQQKVLNIIISEEKRKWEQREKLTLTESFFLMSGWG